MLLLGSTSLHGSYYGQGQAPFLMRRLYCSSSHSSLIACSQYIDNDIALYCGVNNAASVVCLGKHFNEHYFYDLGALLQGRS